MWRCFWTVAVLSYEVQVPAIPGKLLAYVNWVEWSVAPRRLPLSNTSTLSLTRLVGVSNT